VFPKHVEELEKLPGVGPYTARALVAFAYGKDAVFIETNIRTAVIHHFFPKRKKVSDAQIEKVLRACMPNGKAREWNWALMDYGAHLKRSGVRVNAKSKHYVKQSRFAGSFREARGALLRELSKGSRNEARLLGLLGDDRTEQLASALNALRTEGLVRKRGTRYRIA
jgi:A/G-specific adenine glycosylase